MKMKILDPAHLLVILSSDETNSLGLSHYNSLTASMQWNSIYYRAIASRIFSSACAECADEEFNPQGKKISLRAVSTRSGGTALIFTAENHHRIYRIKSNPQILVYSFFSAEDVLSAASLLFKKELTLKSSLYKWNNYWKFMLQVPYKSRPTVTAIVGEFGKLCGKGEGAANYVTEHGRCLCSGNAIVILGSCINKPDRT